MRKLLLHVFILVLICGYISSAKVLFFKKNTIQLDTTTTSYDETTTIERSHIITAPTKCKSGMKLDKRKICRKFV